MLNKLVKIADALDKKGFYAEASELDEIIKSAIDTMEWPQPDDSFDPGDPRTHMYSEEYMGSGEDSEPHRPTPVSEDAREIALKHQIKILREKLVKKYGDEYEPFLRDDVVENFLGVISDAKTSNVPGESVDEYIDRQMKFFIFGSRFNRGECISCGDETSENYLEYGDDYISSPVCDECFSKGLGENEEDFLERKDPRILENLSRFFVEPTDPTEIEESHGDIYEDEDDYDLVPGDDDYDPKEAEKRKNTPSRREMADLWR